jgi:outer membrane lipoprotein SlyB
MQLLSQVFHIRSLVLVLSLTGCASEPFVTDEGSAAAQHADRQNVEFQEKGVPWSSAKTNN